MVFKTPNDVKQIPNGIPNDLLIHQFVLNDSHKYGRAKLSRSKTTFIDGISSKSLSISQIIERVDVLSRTFDKLLGSESRTDPWSRVVCFFTPNTIDYMPCAWAIQKAGGIVSTANAMYGASELAYQLKDCGAKQIGCHSTTLKVCLEAAKLARLPTSSIFTFDQVRGYPSIDDLASAGKQVQTLPEIRLSHGEATTRVAFLCYSSGTTGLPKGAMISHRNVISNVLQLNTYDAQPHCSDVVMGVLPMSHIYALVLVGHLEVFRGNTIIMLPRFTFPTFCASVERYKITHGYIVPPIVIQLLKNPEVRKHDLSSVRYWFVGAAPMSEEVANGFCKLYPKTALRNGYGMTETCTVTTYTSQEDIMLGSSGCLLPNIEARVVGSDGKDIKEFNKSGELWVKGPNVVLGYLHNQQATDATIDRDGWLKTGDEVEVRKSPKGREHFWILERIKELIKVKGMQVAPAELEACLLSHPDVVDAAVIPVPDDYSDELPKAYCVVLKPSESLKKDIYDHVAQQKSGKLNIIYRLLTLSSQAFKRRNRIH